MGLTDLKEKRVKKCKTTKDQTSDDTSDDQYTTYDTLPPGFGIIDLKEKKVKI